MAVVSCSTGLGRSVAAVFEALWMLADARACSSRANHRDQCVSRPRRTSDALGLRFGLPTCASLQPPARSSVCPVPSPCSPQSFFLPPQPLPSSLESRITVVTLLARSPLTHPDDSRPKTTAINSRGDDHVIEPPFTTARTHPHTQESPGGSVLIHVEARGGFLTAARRDATSKRSPPAVER